VILAVEQKITTNSTRTARGGRARWTSYLVRQLRVHLPPKKKKKLTTNDETCTHDVAYVYIISYARLARTEHNITMNGNCFCFKIQKVVIYFRIGHPCVFLFRVGNTYRFTDRFLRLLKKLRTINYSRPFPESKSSDIGYWSLRANPSDNHIVIPFRAVISHYMLRTAKAILKKCHWFVIKIFAMHSELTCVFATVIHFNYKQNLIVWYFRYFLKKV
jgi:hypothetical protein